MKKKMMFMFNRGYIGIKHCFVVLFLTFLCGCGISKEIASTVYSNGYVFNAHNRVIATYSNGYVLDTKGKTIAYYSNGYVLDVERKVIGNYANGYVTLSPEEK